MIAALAEAQGPTIPRPGHIRGLAWYKTAAPCPAAEETHGGSDLVQVGSHGTLQVRDAPLPPLIDQRRRQPADAYEHVDSCGEALFGKGGLSRPDDSPLELGLSIGTHLR